MTHKGREEEFGETPTAGGTHFVTLHTAIINSSSTQAHGLEISETDLRKASACYFGFLQSFHGHKP